MKLKSIEGSAPRDRRLRSDRGTLALERVKNDTWRSLEGDEGGSDWHDELSIVVGERVELFASPGQERCQSAVRVVRDADHVPVGPYLQTD